MSFQYAGELAVREEFPDATIFRPSAIYGNQYNDGFIAYHFSRCKNFVFVNKIVVFILRGSTIIFSSCSAVCIRRKNF